MRHHSSFVGTLKQPILVKHNRGCADSTNGDCSGLHDTTGRYAGRTVLHGLSQETWGSVNNDINVPGHGGIDRVNAARNVGSKENIYGQGTPGSGNAMKGPDVSMPPHTAYTPDPNAYPPESHL